MHSKSDNIEIMSHDKAGKVIEEFFESLLPRYQIGLEAYIKGNHFIFDCVKLLYYKCHKKILIVVDSIFSSVDKKPKRNNKPCE